MSETITQEPNADTNVKAPKAKREPVTMVKLSSIYARKAQMLNTDTTKAAKLVRARMRANFTEVCKLSPNVKKAKTRANDGNRWPSHITKAAATFVLNGK